MKKRTVGVIIGIVLIGLFLFSFHYAAPYSLRYIAFHPQRMACYTMEKIARLIESRERVEELWPKVSREQMKERAPELSSDQIEKFGYPLHACDIQPSLPILLFILGY